MRTLSVAEFLAETAKSNAGAPSEEVAATVRSIIDDVALRGDEALLELSARFDGARPDPIQVPAAALKEAWNQTPAKLQRALRLGRRNLLSVQGRMLPRRRQVRITPVGGVQVHVRWRPLDSVACYAPGGRAAYPSSVLMMAVPARAAGVKRVYIASPPQPDGRPSPHVLAAAFLARADGVFAVGGAQAVAAFALGTRQIPRVPKIVGPGNAYVAEAKRQLFGRVGIESLAGPTELAIVADATTGADLVAADLAAQAEHDPDARTLLVARSPRVAQEVERALDFVLQESPRAEILRHSLDRHGRIVVAGTAAQTLQILEAYAPEHVEFLCRDAARLSARLANAGTIFEGRLAAAPLGDYVTGANHVLPTGRTARWASPLSVYDFLRQEVRQRVTERGLRNVGPAAVAIAEAEGLFHHADAVRRRLR